MICYSEMHSEVHTILVLLDLMLSDLFIQGTHSIYSGYCSLSEHNIMALIVKLPLIYLLLTTRVVVLVIGNFRMDILRII